MTITSAISFLFKKSFTLLSLAFIFYLLQASSTAQPYYHNHLASSLANKSHMKLKIKQKNKASLFVL
jgi:hypothetical protein